jgi:hypothetical protein
MGLTLKPEAVQQLDGLFLMLIEQMGIAHHHGHGLMPKYLGQGPQVGPVPNCSPRFFKIPLHLTGHQFKMLSLSLIFRKNLISPITV